MEWNWIYHGFFLLLFGFFFVSYPLSSLNRTELKSAIWSEVIATWKCMSEIWGIPSPYKSGAKTLFSMTSQLNGNFNGLYLLQRNHNIQSGSESKQYILSEYVNKTEIGGREQTRTATQNMKHCLIFSSEIFCFTIVLSLCLNIPWVKAVNEITVDYTTRPLDKHGVIKVCSIEYLFIEIELVLPSFKSWRGVSYIVPQTG